MSWFRLLKHPSSFKAQREKVQEELSEVIGRYTLFSQGFDWQNYMNMLFLNFPWNILKIKPCFRNDAINSINPVALSITLSQGNVMFK